MKETSIDYIDLNVVILPEIESVKKLLQWSKQIYTKYQTFYQLNRTNHRPHLSLYSARYPLKNKKILFQKVNEIANKQYSFPVTLNSSSVFSGYIFYDAAPNETLQSLHETIVNTLNPLREGLITDNQRQLKGLSDKQLKAIEEYGYVSVKELYMPHISITGAELEKAKQILEELPKEEIHFVADTIAIAHFAQYGTCPNPLVKFRLSS